MRLAFLAAIALSTAALAQTSTWTGNGNGNWSDPNDWSNGVPDSTNAIATFPTSAKSTYVNVDEPVTVGTLNIASGPDVYLLQGSDSITLSTTPGTSAQLNNTAGNNVIIAPVDLGDNATLNISSGELSIASKLSSRGLNVTKTGAGELAVPNIQANSLTISQGELQVLSNGTPAGLSVVHSFSLSTGATFDLTNNSLIDEFNGSSPITTISNEIASAYDSGKWDKPGLTTSSTRAAPTTTLGVGDSSVLGITSYEGQMFGDAVIVGYTWQGDANLDGQVNESDITFIQQQQSANGTGWTAGDFNYDGQINADDTTLLMLGASTQSAILGPTSVTPEPMLVFTLPALFFALLPRRQAIRTR